MVQLEHVDIPNRHLAIEGVAGPAVEHGRLSGGVETRKLQHLLDVGFLGAVEHRRRDRHAVAQIAPELHQFGIVERLDGLVVAVDLLQGLLQRTEILLGGRQIRIDGLSDALAEAGAGPAEMGFENLTDVHAARHTQRVEHDIRVGAVFQERHVLDRNDLGHHALVAVTTGHLVAGLNLALHRDEDLDHLHHAGRQFIATLQLLDLVEEALFKALLRFVVLLPHRLDFGHQLVVGRSKHPPLRARMLIEHRTGDLGVLFEALRTGDALAVFQKLGEAVVDVTIQDRLFVVTVLGQTLDLFPFDRQRTLVLGRRRAG